MITPITLSNLSTHNTGCTPTGLQPLTSWNRVGILAVFLYCRESLCDLKNKKVLQNILYPTAVYARSVHC